MRKTFLLPAALAIGLVVVAPQSASAHSLSLASISLSERIMFADLAAKKAVPGGHPTAIARKVFNGSPVWRVTIARGGRYWWVVVNTETFSVVKTLRI